MLQKKLDRRVEPEVTITFTLRQNHAAALLRAVEELVAIMTARMLRAKSPYAEQLVTEQAVGLGKLRAALYEALPHRRPK